MVDPATALPPVPRVDDVWGGNVCSDPAYLSDGTLLLVADACANRALARSLGRPDKRTSFYGAGTMESALRDAVVYHAWPVSLAVVWEDPFPASDGRLRRAKTRESRRLAGFVDADGEWAATVDAAVLSLVLAALGGVERITASEAPRAAGRAVLGFWKEGLLVGAVYAAEAEWPPRTAPLAGGVPALAALPTGIPGAPPLGTGLPAQPTVSDLTQGTRDAAPPPDAPAPPAAAAGMLDAELARLLGDLGGAEVAPPNGAARAWALAGRAGGVRVERRARAFLARPWRMQVRVRFAAPRRALRLAAEAPWAADAARPRLHAWRVDQQPGEAPADFARRVAAVVAPFALDPAARPPAGAAPDAFPDEPAAPARGALVGPGRPPVYVVAPALAGDDPVRTPYDALPSAAAPDPEARWQVVCRQRWARLGGEGARPAAEGLAARLNALGREA